MKADKTLCLHPDMATGFSLFRYSGSLSKDKWLTSYPEKAQSHADPISTTTLSAFGIQTLYSLFRSLSVVINDSLVLYPRSACPEAFRRVVRFSLPSIEALSLPLPYYHLTIHFLHHQHVFTCNTENPSTPSTTNFFPSFFYHRVPECRLHPRGDRWRCCGVSHRKEVTSKRWSFHCSD